MRTRIRRFIADFQGYIAISLALLTIGSHLHLLPPNFGTANEVLFYLCIAAFVIVAFMGKFTSRNRGRFLRDLGIIIEAFGGQRAVTYFLRRLAKRVYRPNVRDKMDSIYPHMRSLVRRLGYHAEDSLVAYLRYKRYRLKLVA